MVDFPPSSRIPLPAEWAIQSVGRGQSASAGRGSWDKMSFLSVLTGTTHLHDDRTAVAVAKTQNDLVNFEPNFKVYLHVHIADEKERKSLKIWLHLQFKNLQWASKSDVVY